MDTDNSTSMELQRCDSCGKPLGSSAAARGDAVRRGELLVCSACTGIEARGHRLPLVSTPASEAAFRARGAHRGRGNDPAETPTEDLGPACNSCGKALAASAFASGDAFRFPAGALCAACMPDEIMAAGQRKLSGVQLSAKGATPRDSKRDHGSLQEAPGRARTIEAIKTGAKDSPPAGRDARSSSGRRLVLPARASGRQPAIVKPDSAFSPPRMAAGARKTSPYLMAAGLVMLVVLPAFAFALYTAIASQDERNRLQEQYDALVERVNNAPVRERVPLRPAERPAPDEDAAQKPPAVVPPPQSAIPVLPPPVPAADPLDRPVPIPEAARARLNEMERAIAQPLVDRLALPDEGQRILALGDIIAARAVGASMAVRGLLDSPSPALRQLAATALGELDDRGAKASLERLAGKDEALEVRLAARRALTRLGGDFEEIDLAGFTLGELRRLLERLPADEGHAPARELLRRVIDERELRGDG